MEQQRPAALDAEYAKTGVTGRFLGVWGKPPYFLVHTDSGEEAMTANDFERHAGGLPGCSTCFWVCDVLGVAATAVCWRALPVGLGQGFRDAQVACVANWNAGLRRVVACL